jgi:hypothetical protein
MLARVCAETPNLHLMIPFLRTRWELERWLELVDASPLGSDRKLLRWVMAEVPCISGSVTLELERRHPAAFDRDFGAAAVCVTVHANRGERPSSVWIAVALERREFRATQRTVQ